MGQSRIQAVDHVTIEAPFGIDDELRWFYGEALELEERPAPDAAAPGLCFRSERIELRIRFAKVPKIESVDCRVMVGVPRFADMIELFEDRRMDFQRLSGLGRSDRRIHVLDPAGNRAELKQAHDGFPL